jgi:hypothetical protein
MIVTAGQLVIEAGRAILKRIFDGSEPSISEAEIINVVRQNVVGKATTVIVEPGKTSPVDTEMIMLVTYRCMDMLSHISDLEITYSIAADGTRSINVRRTSDTPVDELIRLVGNTEQDQLPERTERVEQMGAQEANARILARIRERVNRPEEGEY